MKKLRSISMGLLLLSLTACNFMQSKEGLYFDEDGNEIPKEKAEALLASTKNAENPEENEIGAYTREKELKRILIKQKSGQQLTQQESTFLSRNRGEIISDSKRRDMSRESLQRKKALIEAQAKKAQAEGAPSTTSKKQ